MDVAVTEIQQVDDDIELLDLMLADHTEAPGEYRATARWDEYSQRFLEFLRTTGLRDFRSTNYDRDAPGGVLRNFGAVDVNPSFNKMGPVDHYQTAAMAFVAPGARNIRELLPSRVGNPQGFEIEGRFYTVSWLNHYLRYAFVTKHMRLKNHVIAEVGPGAGKQAEMLKKAHPNLTILLFDLPTQLYVCNQYLSKVFEGQDQVVDYRVGRAVKDYSDIQPGKINILPHWKFPLLRDRTFDLLWNAASFQEMEPATAGTYLRIAEFAKAMYLMHNIKYREGAPLPGSRGVITPARLPGFFEVDRTTARYVHQPLYHLYVDSFWRRRMDAQKPKRAGGKLRQRLGHLRRFVTG